MLWRTAVQLAQRALPRLVVEIGRWVVPVTAEAGRLPVSSAAARSPEDWDDWVERLVRPYMGMAKAGG